MSTYLTPKVFARFVTLALSALLIAACNGVAIPLESLPENINICHASGDADSPYTELTIAINELSSHSKHRDDIIPAPSGGCPDKVITDGNQGKITICHATGDPAKPYSKISVAFSGLNGHSKHENDMILVPDTADCPLVIATQTATAAPFETALGTPTATPPATFTPQATVSESDNEKITICHATNSKKKAYVMITISVNGLNGHDKHADDIIPAPAGGCP